MPNSTSDASHAFKMLYDAYEDGMFRLAMNDVAEKEGEMLYDENERLKTFPEFMPSKENLKVFSKLLDSHLKEAKQRRNALRYSKMINLAAIVVLAIIIMFSTAMVTVQAFRIKVLNFFISIESKYTSYQLSDSNKNNQNTGGLTINWTNSYVPTYIPEGYEVTSITSSESLKKIIFTNKKNKASNTIYCEYNSSNSIAVDTEKALSLKKIEINGADGTLSVKDNIVTIAWKIDNRLFIIQGDLSTTEAFKLAESVKFNE